MTTFAGLDLSLTSTGMAVATVGRPGLYGASGSMAVELTAPEVSIETRLATSKAPKKQLRTHLPTRFERQTRLAKEIMNFVGGAEVVVIESLFSAGQVGGDQIDRSGLWWRVVGALLMREVEVIAVAPTSAKKFLTGAGNADKGTMVRWATKLWPDWEPSTASSSEDEADAIALVSVGLALKDMAPFPLPEHRKDLVSKLDAQRLIWEDAL